MMKLVVLSMLLATAAQAQTQQRIYDSKGNSQGTIATTPQGTATFRDSKGNTTGTATTTNDTTVFRDNRGNVLGTSRKDNHK
jgi:hypothetical protein